MKILGEGKLGFRLGRWALCATSAGSAYGRLSMPWHEREICSRCAERRDMAVAALVTPQPRTDAGIGVCSSPFVCSYPLRSRMTSEDNLRGDLTVRNRWKWLAGH